VSGCCGEPDCRRTQPVQLFLGDFSGRVYAATRSIRRKGGPPGSMIAREKHDVTRQMCHFIRSNPEWVRAVLAENDSAPRYGGPVDESTP